MYQCQNCDRQIGSSVLLCRSQGTNNCPFDVQEIRKGESRLQGFSFIVLGAILLFLLLFFPLPEEFVLSSSITASIIKIIIVSVFLLTAAFVIFLGLSLAFSKRILIYSKAEKVSYQSFYFQSYQYKTKIIEEVDKFPVYLVEAPIDFPVSLLAYSATPNVDKFLQSKASMDYAFKGLPSGEQDQLKELASQVVEVCLLDMIGRGIISLYTASCYSSQGKNVDQTDSSTVSLLYPGPNILSHSNGQLEKSIIDIVTNWAAQKNWSEQPLAPSISLMIDCLTKESSTNNWLAVLETVSQDTTNHRDKGPEKSGNENSTREALHLIQKNNPKLYRFLKKEVERYFNHEAEKSLLDDIFTLNNFKLKYLRIALVIGVILLITVGRYISGLAKVNEIKEYVKEPRTIESLKESVYSLLPDGSKEKLSASSKKALDQINNWLNQPNEHWQDFVYLAKSADVRIRREVARALGQIHSNSTQVIPTLEKLLRDPDVIVRQYAIQSLSNYPEEAANLTPDLLFLLKNDPQTAAMAAQALGDIGSRDSSEVVAALASAIESQNPLTSLFARQALEKIGTDEALAVLDGLVAPPNSSSLPPPPQPQFE